MHDGVTKSIFAHLILARGVDFPNCEKVVKMIVEDLDTLGYHRVVFRCDNEPSILALLRAVKLAWTDDVVQETSAEGDPQSNGAAESSVNVVKGHVRSICFECGSATEPRLVDVALCRMHRACTVGLQSRRQDSIRTKRGKAHSLVSDCGGCFCSHPTAVWALWIHDLNKEGTWDRWMDRKRCLLARQAVWFKRLPPGERWTGSLLDEALGSELTPIILEDDGGRVGIRAPVLQPHAAVPLPPLAPEVRQVRRAPLRRTDFEKFGYTDNCLGVPKQEQVGNKRWIIQNTVVLA